MAHTLRNKAKLLARIKRISGQTAALEALMQGDRECSEILQQIAAIRGAMNGLMVAVIEEHLTEHLVQEPDVEQRQQDLSVITQVIKSYLK